MTSPYSFLSTIKEPDSIITAFKSGTMFPELLQERLQKYEPFIAEFSLLVRQSSSSAELLERIRDRRVRMDGDKRMTFLKIFRRCVCPVCDTEKTSKIAKHPTASFVENYGQTFKQIELLKAQFAAFDRGEVSALAVLLGEYDDRGKLGYELTEHFFDWFRETFPELSIHGPKRAGKDVQLRSLIEDFEEEYPCDFVIKGPDSAVVQAVGFARYDSTRGGAQSDDRTGGNSDKVTKAQRYESATGKRFKLVFLADGPGLTHNDTWQEACALDGKWSDNVRVTTLKLAPIRITREWLYLDSGK